MTNILSGFFTHSNRYPEENYDSVLGRLERLEAVVSELKQTVDLLRSSEYNLNSYTLGK
jgi:hypothetical protein